MLHDHETSLNDVIPLRSRPKFYQEFQILGCLNFRLDWEVTFLFTLKLLKGQNRLKNLIQFVINIQGFKKMLSKVNATPYWQTTVGPTVVCHQNDGEMVNSNFWSGIKYSFGSEASVKKTTIFLFKISYLLLPFCHSFVVHIHIHIFNSNFRLLEFPSKGLGLLLSNCIIEIVFFMFHKI